MDDRTAKDVIDEKYEDRGCGECAPTTIPEGRQEPEKLPISERDYQTLSLLIGKLALQDQDKKLCSDLCDVFFEIERRASFGNRYNKTEELEAVERKMWTLGTGQEIEEPKNINSSPKKR